MPPTINHGSLSADGGLMGISWRQYIGAGKGWTGGGVFGHGDCSVTQTFDVPWNDIEKAIARLLGYSHRSDRDSKKIRRWLPARHPVFDWMYAVKVTGIEGVGPLGSADIKGANGDYMRYDTARLTVQFSPLPYDVLPDAQTEVEWKRFVEDISEPAGEYIVRKEGSFKIINLPNNATETFKGQKSQLLLKYRLTLTWHQVPEDGLLNRLGVPVNIVNGIGKVNDKPWPLARSGFPAGTMLCEAPPKIKPVQSPARPGFLGPNAFLARSINVTFSFLVFDPPRGDTVPAQQNNPLEDYKIRGHNLAPRPANNRWYPLVAQDGATPLYQSYDFDKFFQLCEPDSGFEPVL